MKLVYTERALADIDLAIEWYETQRKGLGLEFLGCLEEGILKVITNPELYRKKYKNIRSVAIRRFPFTMFYSMESEDLVVHAVFHNRLDPAKRP